MLTSKTCKTKTLKQCTEGLSALELRSQSDLVQSCPHLCVAFAWVGRSRSDGDRANPPLVGGLDLDQIANGSGFNRKLTCAEFTTWQFRNCFCNGWWTLEYGRNQRLVGCLGSGERTNPAGRNFTKQNCIPGCSEFFVPAGLCAHLAAVQDQD